MNKLGRIFGAAAVLALGSATAAHADGVFINGNYCGGNAFQTCASVTASNVGDVITLTVTNTSGNAGSVFTAIGLANLGAGVTISDFSSDLPTRFEVYDESLPGNGNDLSGAGILGVAVGGKASNPAPQNGLKDGETVTFTFTLGGTYSLDNVQFALHDQGGAPEGCDSSTKLVVSGPDANGGGVANDPTCGTTTVPEPMTMSLLATGLASMGGLGAFKRRRAK